MRLIIKTMVLAALLALSACSAALVAPQNPAAGFPFRHSDFDYRVAWKTTEGNAMVAIDGIVKNVRYPFINSIDLMVYLLGPDGKTRARATTFPMPQQSLQNEVIPFRVELRSVSLQPGDTLKFLIHYGASEGGEDGGVDWRSTFAADAITGAVLHRDNLRPEEW